jgi:CubicO group peptidase (beta-lactamase class C family)
VAAPSRGTHPHGTYFLYNNWDFNVAGTVFEQLTGRSIYADFEDRVLRTLQLEDYEPKLQRKLGDPKKSAHLAYSFTLSTRDMARLGQLMLNSGAWNGVSVVPSSWVHEITTPRTRSTEMHPKKATSRGMSYGYMWWVSEEPEEETLHGSYMAWGVHGQFILVIPKYDMVIAHKRRVPEGTDWNVSWVGLQQFLHGAKLLVRSRCN